MIELLAKCVLFSLLVWLTVWFALHSVAAFILAKPELGIVGVVCTIALVNICRIARKDLA